MATENFRNDTSSDKNWWHNLNQECPITLELLSTLPYPPFSLSSGGNNVSYFDGLALASYIVSRGIFQNPLTRQDLTMDDCRRLDEYLEDYCYKYQRGTSRKIAVAEAFALRASVQVQPRDGSRSDRVQTLRNTATAALAGLFVFGNNRPTRPSQEDSIPALPREDQLVLEWGFDLSRAVEDGTESMGDAGWTVIDDDKQ